MNDGVRRSRWNEGDIYEGRKSALIEAGVAKAEWFPETPTAR